MVTTRRPRAARSTFVHIAGRLAGVATLALATLGGGPPALGAGGSYTYPTDCPTKLQICIDMAIPGDTVFVAMDGFSDEHVAIGNKGMTLTAQAGFHPTVRSIRIWANAGAIDVTVAGLRVDRSVEVLLFGGSDHRVVLRKLDVDQPSDVAGTGILMSTTVPASFVLERSRIHTESTGRDSVSVAANDPGGLVTLDAQSNRIDQVGGAGNAGFRLQASGDGTLRAAIRSTTIHDVAEESAGGGAGITLYFGDAIKADVGIAGVTLHGIQSNGINLRNDVVGAGHLDLAVFDTIISYATGNAMVFDPAGPITFRAGYNDRWRNGGGFEVGGRSMGPVNLKVDPRFVERSAGNLRLRADSPLLDRGLVCSPAGVSGRDAGGRARLAGTSVDIGGHERGATAAPVRVQLGTGDADELAGTSAVDILCGFGGPDDLRGRGAGDWLDGGAGPDTLVGGRGRDRLLGGDGNDALCGRDGAPGDRLVGGLGSDRASRDAGDTLVSIESTNGCER